MVKPSSFKSSASALATRESTSSAVSCHSTSSPAAVLCHEFRAAASSASGRRLAKAGHRAPRPLDAASASPLAMGITPSLKNAIPGAFVAPQGLDGCAVADQSTGCLFLNRRACNCAVPTACSISSKPKNGIIATKLIIDNMIIAWSDPSPKSRHGLCCGLSMPHADKRLLDDMEEDQ
jgi:hypothetical protein